MLVWRKILTLLFLCLPALILAGCGADDRVYLERTGEAATETEAAGVPVEDTKYRVPGTEEANRPKMPETELADCYVYVCGAVNAPGVYVLPPGGRVYEAVELAGGLTENASVSSVNQAEVVSDGEMVWIPTIEEAAASDGAGAKGRGNGTAGQDSQEDKSGRDRNAAGEDDGRLDLNQATAAELMTLPGIGQSKADSIIAYRTAHGGFAKAEDVMNVDGIKEGVYNRIKDSIKVK